MQHNPTPRGFKTGKGNAYESDLRDKRRGRVYRVVYTGGEAKGAVAGLAEATDLGDSTPQQLVAALRHPTMLVRQHAQRLLVERANVDVIPALIEMLQDESVDEIDLNVGAIHAIWTLEGLGAFEGTPTSALAVLHAALSHPSAGVRRNAIQALPAGTPDSIAVFAFSGIVEDEDMQVRLAAILKLAEMRVPELAGYGIANLLTDREYARDRWLNDALTSAAASDASTFLQRLSELSHQDDVAKRLTEDVATVRLIAVVSEHLIRAKPSSEELNRLIQKTFTTKADPRLLAVVLDGLAKGLPKDPDVAIADAVLAHEAEQAIVGILDRLPAGAQGKLVKLASAWGSKALETHTESITKTLLETVAHAEGTSERLAAARQALEFRAADERVALELIEQVTPRADPEFIGGLLDALSASTASNVGPELILRMPGMAPSSRRAAIRTLLARPQTTRALLAALEGGQAYLSELSLDEKRSLAEHPNEAIRDRAKKILAAGDSLPDPDRQKVVEQLLPLVERNGSVDAGFEVFKKHCAKCHRHRDVGENIGPNLTGMAVHPKAELLIQILDPSRSVEGNFRQYTVTTTGGRVYTGMMASETRTSIELVDTEAKRHVIQRSDIDQLVASPKSMMPEGFEKQASQEDLANLLEFLTDPGAYLPIDLRKAATIVSTRGMFNRKDAGVERLIFPDWKPKTFNGVPFVLVDPQGDRVPNVIMLRGSQGKFPPQMPKRVSLQVNAPAKAIHLLSGVGGWSYPAHGDKSVSVILRLHYADGVSEDHELLNGVHFADYIRRVDVPGSEFAFALRDQQIRYLAIHPKRTDVAIEQIVLIKGDDPTAPIVMAITVETPRN